MAEVIGIVSGKGGVGKTTIAVNLSIALKQLGKKVLLIDLNISTPHTSYYLGVYNYRYTLNDALSNKVNELSLINNIDGVRFIPSSPSLEDIVKIYPKQMEKILNNFKKYMNFDYIIIDSAPGIGREAVTSMSVSDKILFVAVPYLPSISDIIKCKRIAEELGKEDMEIVLNMYDGYSYEISPSIVEKMTGLKVIGEIPFDKMADIALSAGIPLINYKPNSFASLSILKIASKLAGVEFKEHPKLKIRRMLVKIKDKFMYSFSQNSVKIPEV